jgi:hypothetical protein
MGNGRTQASPEGSPDVLDEPSRGSGKSPRQHAIRALLEDIMNHRKGGCPHAAGGPALVIGIDLGIEGENGGAPGEAPGCSQRARERESAGSDGCAPPFPFSGLRQALEAMASAPGGGPRPGEGAPAAEQADGREEFAEVEEFYHQQTLMIEDEGRGKLVTAAVVGFGMGAAAMFLARHLQPSGTRVPRGIH